MNIVLFTGRLTATPELKTTPNGKMVTTFTVANDIGWGENKKTNFINCVAWEKTADTISKYFSKGDPILINGEIQTRSYEKDGAKRTVTEVRVARAEFFSGKKADGKTEEATSYNPYDNVKLEEVADDEDLPF